METVLRAYVGFALALCIALGSISHAQARNQAHGATTMVICTGYGLVRITMDVDGNPVEQTLPCPDCVLSFAALPTEPTPKKTSIGASQSVVFAARPHHAYCPAGLWLQSRAPPLFA